ncbi:hypothetical protein SAMD00024442_5_38 [Candidatus Symbiothrix dinenymphae]|nr:hypothetical protein SAMD00024442_5_38 [Candidatus Symbiothrix dinenymphae]
MKIVLDTNCLLVSVQKYSKFFWLWQAFRDKKITLCYTTEILNEYYEILSHYYSSSLAESVVGEILMSKSAAEPITVYFNWQLITTDIDDNKYVDCAVSANADYIVTNDRHFNILNEIEFPRVNIVTINDFQEKI